jgi:hypothetical protein
MVVLAMGMAASAMAALASMLTAAWLWPLVETGQQLAAVLQVPLVGLIPQPSLGIAASGR